ncbi:hypothetical protein ACEUZ9_000032 [Paracoccus litorisediminis]|uniref:cupin domain-containing protein n=1 Tax=Paracoccus litorisediminis TaxID=2006130 RepID=UPI0037330D90
MIAPLSAEDIEAARDNDRIGTDLVHQGNGMCVWHLRLLPGQTLAAHRHDRPYMWTVLTDGRAQSRREDGVIDVIYRAGQTQHFPDLSPQTGFIHDLTNSGENDLIFVTVEFGN